MIKRSAKEFPLEPPPGLDTRFCEVMDAAPVMIWVSGQDKLCNWHQQARDLIGRIVMLGLAQEGR